MMAWLAWLAWAVPAELPAHLFALRTYGPRRKLVLAGREQHSNSGSANGQPVHRLLSLKREWDLMPPTVWLAGRALLARGSRHVK